EENFCIVFHRFARFANFESAMVILVMLARQVLRFLPGMPPDQVPKLLIEHRQHFVRIRRRNAIPMQTMRESLELLIPRHRRAKGGSRMLSYFVRRARVFVSRR